MKILLCHNSYQQPGGEDKVFADEGELLESHGHQLVRYHVHNDKIASMSSIDIFKKTIWNSDTTKNLTRLIQAEQPDVMHCHNTFPLISPSAYYAAKNLNVAVVQTLHNYRTICPKAVLFRDGRFCNKCVGRQLPWPSIVHRCYRDSRAASVAVAAMLSYHNKLGTWTNSVDHYIALSEASKNIFIEAGWPEHKISIKPNFIQADIKPGKGSGNYAIFVGRLSKEKGVQSLLDAWRLLSSDLELKILGDGPEANIVVAAAAADSRIQWLGHQSIQTVYSLIGEAQFLIMPSVWPEPFGLSMIESLAKGTPVIASRTGAMEEIIRQNVTGLLYSPGKAAELASVIEQLIAQPELVLRMRSAARVEFESRYTPQSNYHQLISIYQRAIRDNRSSV